MAGLWDEGSSNRDSLVSPTGSWGRFITGWAVILDERIGRLGEGPVTEDELKGLSCSPAESGGALIRISGCGASKC
jgi:hypothetical protein